GIQVIDVGIAIDEFQTMISQVGTSGAITQLVNAQTGAYRGSITNTIPVSAGGWPNAPLAGITAGDFILDGSSQVLVLATGSRVAPLVVANPQLPGSSAVLYAPESISTEAGTLTSGASVTTATVGDKQIAVVTGTGTVADGNGGQSAVGNVLVVFDMTNPRQPIPMGFVALDAYGKSATILGGTVFVGTNDHTIMVSLTNPTHPVISGTIESFGGRLSITMEKTIWSADPNRQSVQSAQLEPAVIIKQVSIFSKLISGDINGSPEPPVFESVDDNYLEIQVVPYDSTIKNGLLTLNYSTQPPENIGLTYNEKGKAVFKLPVGKQITGDIIRAKATAIKGNGEVIEGKSRSIPVGTAILVMDFNNNTDVNEAEDLPLKKTNKTSRWYPG
ncbi:MAG: hypothetical protein JXA73_26045, partial [Acidobacteria bacterium]|nr:hypothetical protein [Acidobacteriota bacterium]